MQQPTYNCSHTREFLYGLPILAGYIQAVGYTALAYMCHPMRINRRSFPYRFLT